MAARENPYAEYLHWELSSMHLIYDVCDTYMEHDEGLGLGNFSLGNAPLPHPFCRCLYYVDSSKSLSDIGDEIGRWISGEENSRLDGAFGEWKAAALDTTPKKFIIGAEQNRSLPLKSEKPYAIYDLVYPNGTVSQRRYYGKDQLAEMDIDTSNHKQPLGHPMGAHKHTWDMKGNRPVRSKPLCVSNQDILGNPDILFTGEGGNVNYVSDDES